MGETMDSLLSLSSLPSDRRQISAASLKWGLGGAFVFGIATTIALFELPKGSAGACQASGILPVFGATTEATLTATKGMVCPLSLRTAALVIETVDLIEAPTNGVVAVQGHKGLTYTSRRDFEGEDAFVVSLRGAYGLHRGSAIIRVSVNVK